MTEPQMTESVEKSLVSVILPVYQAEHTVARAITSILEQSHDQLELIVVDDGSTDGTADVTRAVLASYPDRRSRFITIAHQGVAAAANYAIDLAEGDFIARMDGDDWAHPDRLKRQLSHLLANELDLLGSHVSIRERCGDGVTREVDSLTRYQNWINSHESQDELRAMRFVEYPIANPTAFARRWVFELKYRTGELDGSLFPEDYEWFLRAMHAGAKAGKVPEVLLHWMDGETRLTRSHPCYTPEAFNHCRRHYLALGPLAAVIESGGRVDHWGAGKGGKPWLRWLLEKLNLKVRHVYDIDPKKIGQKIHGVKVLHPDDMPEPDGTPLVIAVGAEGGRPSILPHLAAYGYVPGRDSWFVC